MSGRGKKTPAQTGHRANINIGGIASAMGGGGDGFTPNAAAGAEDMEMYSPQYEQALGGTPFFKDSQGNLTRNPVQSNVGFWGRLAGRPDPAAQINTNYAQTQALMPLQNQQFQTQADIGRKSAVQQAVEMLPTQVQQALQTHYANRGVAPSDINSLTPIAATTERSNLLNTTSQADADREAAINRGIVSTTQRPFLAPTTFAQGQQQQALAERNRDMELDPVLTQGKWDVQEAQQKQALLTAQKAGERIIQPNTSYQMPPLNLSSGTSLNGFNAKGQSDTVQQVPFVNPVTGKPTGMMVDKHVFSPAVINEIEAGYTPQLKGAKTPGVTPPISQVPSAQTNQSQIAPIQSKDSTETPITPTMAKILEDPRLDSAQKVQMVMPMLQAAYPNMFPQKRTYENPDDFRNMPGVSQLLKAFYLR